MRRSGLLMSFILLAGCAASRVSPVEPWRVEVTSSGGLAGHGAGTFAVASDGVAHAKLPNGQACTFQLTAAELARTKELLAAARRTAWKPSYVPEQSCCDRFSYTLTIDEAGAVTTTRWIDDPLPMPPDLSALSGLIVGGGGSIRAISAERCK